MKRSERIVAITNYFLEHPFELISLPYFSETYVAAKSSISEDLDIIDHMFQQEGIGKLQTVAGAAGGVQYLPFYSKENSDVFINQLCEKLNDPERILPGGYLYMSDLLGDPETIRNIGKIFATAFADKGIEYIVTVATKGIPLAYATANILNVPVVIVRRDPKVTEGSTVSINYVSGSSKKIQTMVLAKRSLPEGSTVCIIDDFMKAGGTINGMKSLLKEFQAHVAGIGVLAEAEDEDEERMIDEYVSLIKIHEVNLSERKIDAKKGNYFQ
ncbi:purine operon repressor [Salirhabdus euzebyi]|uniref:Purine operon repressor n=1 Tax=Salirhabdus euzebyi TaxID=394506 RepID=A0A841Q9R1_9BACI|nr:pur operon repressor [Salirhabdus euzebyi]MBB6455241.1 purine operon repressor [Salirhabdus euzebyi]